MNKESFDRINQSALDFTSIVDLYEPSFGVSPSVDAAMVAHLTDAFKDMQDEIAMELGAEPDDLPASVVECKSPAKEALDGMMGDPIGALAEMITPKTKVGAGDWIKTVCDIRGGEVPAWTKGKVTHIADDGFLSVSFDGITDSQFIAQSRFVSGDIVKIPTP